MSNPGPAFIVIDSSSGIVQYRRAASGTGDIAFRACYARAVDMAHKLGRSFLIFLDIGGHKVGARMSLPMVVPDASLPSSVTIYEVGPRDGLQNEQTVVPLEVKVELVERLVAAGLPVVEATSFVHPTWVPQLADAAQGQGIQPGKGLSPEVSPRPAQGIPPSGMVEQQGPLAPAGAPRPGGRNGGGPEEPMMAGG